MGKQKHLTMVQELFRKSPVVSNASIHKIVKNKEYTKQLLKNLVRKGSIHRLTKGYYTAQDDPSLIVHCFKPAYLGLQDALSHHNLWEQETIPIIITTRKIRPGIRTIMGANILLRRIQKKYYFGIQYDQDGLPYSDIEKTLIDMAYFKQAISDEAKHSIKEKIDKKKLHDYLKTYPQKIKNTIRRYL